MRPTDVPDTGLCQFTCTVANVGFSSSLLLCVSNGVYSSVLFPGLLCDLLWSDPDKEVAGWGENDRGVSFTFGADVVVKFLNRHDLDLICRAHQVGYAHGRIRALCISRDLRLRGGTRRPISDS